MLERVRASAAKDQSKPRASQGATVPASGAGIPLAAADRAFFESAFGTDLSMVRVHADRDAAVAATGAGANAYTVGRDITFAAGRYSPSTPVGLGLLAHELSHVVQQRPGRAWSARAGDAQAEADADQASHAAVTGRSAVVAVATGLGMARQAAEAPAASQGAVPSLQDVQTLSDEELETQLNAVRTWMLEHPTNRADPNYEEAEQRLALLEQVMNSRNPQYAARERRQQTEATTVGVLATASHVVPGVPHAEIIPFLVELGAGMGERFQQLPQERIKNQVVRYGNLSLPDRVRFQLGFLKGFGIGIWEEIKGIGELIALPFKAAWWLVSNGARMFSDWDSSSGEAASLLQGIRALVDKASEEIGKAFTNQAQAWRQLDSLFQHMVKSGLQKANEMGRLAADKMLEFVEQGTGKVGEGLGNIVGHVFFNVVLLVASDAIGNLVKEGLGLVGRLGSAVASGAGEVMGAVARFLPKVSAYLKWLGTEALTFLKGTMTELEQFIKRLAELIGKLLAKPLPEAVTPEGVRVSMKAEEEAAEGTRAMMSSAEGKPPGRTTKTTVDELYGREGTGKGSRARPSTPGSQKVASSVDQYVGNLRSRFPKLAEANLRSVARHEEQAGAAAERMLTGSGSKLKADFAERASGAIEFDDINEEGKIIDSKDIDTGRQFRHEEREWIDPRDPPATDVHEYMTGSRGPHEPPPWMQRLPEENEIELTDQVRFARAHNLNGVEWRTTSSRYAELVKQVIHERGWEGFVEIIDVSR
jgi:hypothetical protein